MDDLEQRLTAALRAEAAKVQPRAASWSGRPSTGSRPRWATWPAAAAVVAVLVVGITLVLGRDGSPQATHPPADATGAAATLQTSASPAPAACDGGWTAFAGSVITAAGESVPPGTSAILRFAGGANGRAILCAVVSAADTTTLANGSAGPDATGSTYLTTISGVDSFLVGAFGPDVARVTVTRPASAALPTGWSVTITSTTHGISDLGNGWYGYAVLAPPAGGEVDMTATGPGGNLVGHRKVAISGARDTTARSTPMSPATSTATTSPATTQQSTISSPRSSAAVPAGGSALRCGAQLARPLPGVSAAIVPLGAGGWQFRLTNGTTHDLTLDTLRGYAEVLSDDQGRIESISQDDSYVLRRPTVLRPGQAVTMETVGVNQYDCTGHRLPAGDRTVHLVLTGVWAGRPVEFTAATFVLRFPLSGAPMLVG